MYSTPGISQSSFSIGRVTRSSTSLALAPGMATITSIIGTLICGSSSRGSRMIAASAQQDRGDDDQRRELRIDERSAAMRPAMPSDPCVDGECSLMAGIPYCTWTGWPSSN